jgi:pimeloyl-ACP methyl ester carboxylesterase
VHGRTPAPAVPGKSASVESADGTPIAFSRVGRGDPVILVDGALCWRAMGPSQKLAEQLAERFTVITYDRRGRGESGDRQPYSVEREVEDIGVLLREAGGSACVCGTSSGAVLALEAAARLRGVTRLALHEAPLVVDAQGPPAAEQWVHIDAAIAENRRAEAVSRFLRGVGVPRLVVGVMRLTPVWAKLKAAAHTLPHDGRIVRAYQRGEKLPAERWTSVTAPALVMAGSRSPEWMQRGNRALAKALPDARFRLLDGQTHVVKPKVLGPILEEFFGR